jgi:hypothetical protein
MSVLKALGALLTRGRSGAYPAASTQLPPSPVQIQPSGQKNPGIGRHGPPQVPGKSSSMQVPL